MLRPNVEINFQTVRYEVKTATTLLELFGVFRLRYKVFFLEFAGLTGQKKILPLDVDRYDFSFDHLIVKDKQTNEVVASYRLLASINKKIHNPFYTESEFNLDEFLKLTDNKVELGRASVHKDYRKGTVVILLWQGLYEYVKKTNSRYLFGCSSISRSHFNRIGAIRAELQERGLLDLGFKAPVRKSFSLSSYPDLVFEEQSENHEKGLNSLMAMYSLAGAKFGEQMAYDKEMDCLDLFTCLDFHSLPKVFEQKLSRNK